MPCRTGPGPTALACVMSYGSVRHGSERPWILGSILGGGYGCEPREQRQVSGEPVAPEKTVGGWNCYLERTAGSGGGGVLAAPSPEGVVSLLFPFPCLCADRCTASCLFPRYAEMCTTPPRTRAWPAPEASLLPPKPGTVPDL